MSSGGGQFSASQSSYVGVPPQPCLQPPLRRRPPSGGVPPLPYRDCPLTCRRKPPPPRMGDSIDSPWIPGAARRRLQLRGCGTWSTACHTCSHAACRFLTHRFYSSSREAPTCSAGTPRARSQHASHLPPERRGGFIRKFLNMGRVGVCEERGAHALLPHDATCVPLLPCLSRAQKKHRKKSSVCLPTEGPCFTEL